MLIGPMGCLQQDPRTEWLGKDAETVSVMLQNYLFQIFSFVNMLKILIIISKLDKR